MSCRDIPQLLKADPQGKKGCENVASNHPGCICEKESIVPELSPGVVSEEETLARFIHSEYVDPDTNEAMSAAFTHVARNGMSVTRIEHAGIKALALQEQEKHVGYVHARSGEIREIKAEDHQIFAIYDTALPENLNHADVCQTILRPPSYASELRRKLQKTFTAKPRSAKQA